MIETAIHVLIGFLSAALVALTALPAISRRAFRLANARARMVAPLSEAQARADRDALRGQHAIEIMAVERRFKAAEDSLSLTEIELGRRIREIRDLEVEMAKRGAEIINQRSEIAGLGQDLRDHETEIASREMALLDLTYQRQTAETRLAHATVQINELQTTLNKHQSMIASLESRVAGLTLELGDARNASEAAQAESCATIAELTNEITGRRATLSGLALQLSELEARHNALRIEADGRAAESAQLRQRLADLEPKHSEMERVRDALALEATRQTARAAERDSEIRRLNAMHREEMNRFQDRLAGSAARENELTMRVQALVAARFDAEGALRHAKAERDLHFSELERLREKVVGRENVANSVSDSNADLRQAIVRLGLELSASNAEFRFHNLMKVDGEGLTQGSANAIGGLSKKPTANEATQAEATAAEAV